MALLINNDVAACALSMEEAVAAMESVLKQYAQGLATFQPVTSAKTASTGKVVTALKGRKFGTVLGEIGFDAKGDVSAPGYVVYEWKDGKYDYVK